MLKNILRFLVIGALLVALPVALSLRTASKTNAGGMTCPGDFYISQPLSGSTVSGSVTLQASIPTSQQVSQVAFTVNNNAVGSGAPTSPGLWTMSNFGTTTMPNGTYPLSADIYTPSTSAGSPMYYCSITAIPITIQNNANIASYSLHAAIAPTSWSGPTNYPVAFQVSAAYVNNQTGQGTNVTGSAVYTWSSSIGSLQFSGSNNSQATFISPQAGSGTVTVKVSYNNQTTTVTSSVTVMAYTASSGNTTPTGTNPPPGSTSTTSTGGTSGQTTGTPSATDASTTTPPPPAQVLSDTVKKCLQQILPATTYQQVLAGQAVLPLDKLSLIRQCFGVTQAVIPATIAPIAPDRVRSLPVTLTASKLAVSKAETVVSNGVQALRFSGTAQPNQIILVYVFSEPLVLTTTADASGNWSYTLDNPMEPGSHQAYVVVDGQNNQPVRSSNYNFAVLASAKTSSNPLGLSYLVAQHNNPSNAYKLYGMVAAGVIVAAGAIIYVIIRRKRRKLIAPQDANLIQPV